MDDFQAILARITVLETRQEERWANHDRNSEQHWTGIKDQLNDIKERIEGLVTCREYNEAIGGIRGQINWLWGSICGAIGSGGAAFIYLLNKK